MSWLLRRVSHSCIAAVSMQTMQYLAPSHNQAQKSINEMTTQFLQVNSHLYFGLIAPPLSVSYIYLLATVHPFTSRAKGTSICALISGKPATCADKLERANSKRPFTVQGYNAPPKESVIHPTGKNITKSKLHSEINSKKSTLNFRKIKTEN